jgi:cytochrome c oxidase subunit 4
MSGHTVEEIRQETRKYWIVFSALVALTVITVAVSYLDLSVGMAVFVALLVACVKGGLVAGVFMHLISERQAIYSILLLTVVFFVILMLGPLFGREASTGIF